MLSVDCRLPFDSGFGNKDGLKYCSIASKTGELIGCICSRDFWDMEETNCSHVSQLPIHSMFPHLDPYAESVE